MSKLFFKVTTSLWDTMWGANETGVKTYFVIASHPTEAMFRFLEAVPDIDSVYSVTLENYKERSPLVMFEGQLFQHYPIGTVVQVETPKRDYTMMSTYSSIDFFNGASLKKLK